MALHNEIGKKGEELAKTYILKKGYEIIKLNWRHQKEEVDIIALYKEMIVFIEVKARSSSYYGLPQESVNYTKQQYLISAADAYLEINNINKECRFDVISIIFNRNAYQIEHIEDAFSASI